MNIYDARVFRDMPEGELPGGKSSLTDSEQVLLKRLEDGMRLGDFVQHGSCDSEQTRHDMADALALEFLGMIRFEWRSSSKLLNDFYSGSSDRDALCRENPGLWNAHAYEHEWESVPEFNDFLNPMSPIFHTKQFETEIYMELLAPYLERLAPGRVFDAAGGIGRFAVEFSRRGHEVVLADASADALKCAWNHLSKESGAFHLELEDLENLSHHPDASFDAVLAMESLCYTTRPDIALRELLRVAKPGALVAISVENTYGALLGDVNLYADNVLSLLSGNILLIEEFLYVNYFSKSEFADYLGLEGFTPDFIEGCHFTSEGVLSRLVDEKSLADPEFRDEMRALERRCRIDPVLSALPRAWLAVGYKN